MLQNRTWAHAFAENGLLAGQRGVRASLLEKLQLVEAPDVGEALHLARHSDHHWKDGGWRWEDFASTEPVTSYTHWRGLVSDQMHTGRQRLTQSPAVRYQPTSGSSSAIKWIPYTRQFLQELDGGGHGDAEAPIAAVVHPRPHAEPRSAARW